MLKNKNARSCGCKNYQDIIHGNRKYKPEKSLLMAKASNYKSHAKRRKIEWNLKTEEAANLMIQNCYYCGRPPSAKFSHPSLPHSGSIIRNGIDRKNNKLGYFKDNVVPCCKICNSAKNDLTYDQFMLWLNDLTQFRTQYATPSHN